MLHHFSDNGQITRFVPRPVRVPSARPPGQGWLNGPLVWAIDATFAYLYLFPRDCPRIVIWATPQTSDTDRQTWLGGANRVAYVPADWIAAINESTIYRYDLPSGSFVTLGDVGMAVSTVTVTPAACTKLDDLPSHLAASDVVLRPVPDLKNTTSLFDTTLHVSAIRLRNAR